MPKEVVFYEDFQRKMQSGVDQLANALKPTLGPKGRNVVIQKTSGGIPLMANDGETIAKEIELEDDIENMGMQLLKEVSLKTKDAAGDGTTTSIVLAQAIIRDGYKNIAAGASTVEIKKGIQGAMQVAAAAIKKSARPIVSWETIAQVAATSAKDASIGAMIAEAMEKVGSGGVITVEESESRETTLLVKEGMHLDVGYLSSEMVTDRERMVAELDHPYILITNRKICDPQELVPLLDQITKTGRPLLIIAESMDSKTLGMLVMNKARGFLKVAAVHPPAYGDGRIARMEDLACLTGGTFIQENLGYLLQNTTIDMLGSAASVRVDRKSTIIIGGSGDRLTLETRIQYLRMRLEKSEYDYDKRQLEERLAKLGKGVAIIKVGAATEIELKEKKMRVENALNSAKAASVEGIVPGGGAAYIHILPAINAYVRTLSGDMKTGASILGRAMEEPARQILNNAGFESGPIIAGIGQRPAGVGFNVVTGEYTNMMDSGIIDSARMVRFALQSAASVSAMLLSVEAGVTGARK